MLKKLKPFVVGFFYEQKTYLYCAFCMFLIPIVHRFYHPLSFEFQFGFEMFFGALMLMRHTLAKIHGHRNDKYMR